MGSCHPPFENRGCYETQLDECRGKGCSDDVEFHQRTAHKARLSESQELFSRPLRPSGSACASSCSHRCQAHLGSSPFQSAQDRKSTRLNSSHQINSYAVFYLKKKKVAAQTPQAFVASTLRDVLIGDLACASDCASLVEARGGRVKVVKDDRRLLKITGPEELA